MKEKHEQFIVVHSDRPNHTYLNPIYHTHPSHSQTSRLLTSSLSLGLPVPRPTQCVRGA
jgi:hypothetical protein